MTVEPIIEVDEFLEQLKNNFLGLFPEDIYIRLLIVAMALVFGYGLNKILTDTPNTK